MNQSISRRISYFNIFFTICIVCYHCGSPAIGPSRLNLLLNDIFDGFCAVAMSYFFTVTGFLLFNNLSSRTYARKIKSRIRTLLMPYLCWEILFRLCSQPPESPRIPHNGGSEQCFCLTCGLRTELFGMFTPYLSWPFRPLSFYLF